MGGFEDFRALTEVLRMEDLMLMGYRIPFSKLQLPSGVTAKRFAVGFEYKVVRKNRNNRDDRYLEVVKVSFHIAAHDAWCDASVCSFKAIFIEMIVSVTLTHKQSLNCLSCSSSLVSFLSNLAQQHAVITVLLFPSLMLICLEGNKNKAV